MTNLNSLYFEGIKRVSFPIAVQGKIIILISSIKSSLLKAPSIVDSPYNVILSIPNNFFNLIKLVLISILSFPAKMYEIFLS